jgi:hypothetical protein
MAAAIEFILGNFTLTFLILGFVAAGIAVLRKPDGATFANIAEELLAYFILFSVTLSFFYNFIFHVFFGELAAGFIGWADSPFQAEVGYASLGFAAIGLLAFRGDFRTRLAAILGTALFQWGAAVGHIIQIATTGNLAPGNAGIMLYTDIFLPLIGFALLWLKRQATMRTPQAAMVPRAISG